MSQYDKVNRAAALKYSQDISHSAPVVVASGLGYVAQKIIAVAQDNNVPVYQDDSLASLLSQMNAGTEIPPELYQSIVDIYIYFLHFQLKDKDESAPKIHTDPAPAVQEEAAGAEDENDENDDFAPIEKL